MTVYLVATVGGQVLTPIIMRRATDIPQTLVIVAILAGAAVGGLLGLVVSIPLVAALLVFTRRVLAPVVRRWTGAAPVSAAPVGPAPVGPALVGPALVGPALVGPALVGATPEDAAPVR